MVEKYLLFFGERIVQFPSFDELEADQLKQLIQSGFGKKPRNNSTKKTKNLPFKEKVLTEESQWGTEKEEAY